MDIGGSGHAGQVRENKLSSAFSKGNGAGRRLLGGEGMPLELCLRRSIWQECPRWSGGSWGPRSCCLGNEGGWGEDGEDESKQTGEEATEENRGEPGRVWGLAAW